MADKFETPRPSHVVEKSDPHFNDEGDAVIVETLANGNSITTYIHKEEVTAFLKAKKAPKKVAE